MFKWKFSFAPKGGSKLTVQHPLWLMKKHYCPQCRGELNRVTRSETVNSQSPEAEQYDFSMPGGGWYRGDVKFSRIEFCCSRCGKHYTIYDIRKREGY